MNTNQTISLTFGDCGENHVGMEKVGNLVKKGHGFNLEDLNNYITKFSNTNKCELYNLKDLLDGEEIKNKKFIEDAYLLVIKNGLKTLLNLTSNNIEELIQEMNSFEWDRKYYDIRRQKVLNKQARANVCFGNISCEPDYENRKGRIVSYDSIPVMKNLKINMEKYLGPKAQNMICEGNKYFDLKKCGIGYHGDSERRKVIAFRLGSKMNIHYNWFFESKNVGNTLKLTLESGDMYIMSEKAVGTDWKKRNIYTLRHSAGLENSKYLKLKY